MGTFIAIAWRSLWRNRRRSVLTLSMISFGLFLCIVMESIVSGTQEQIFKGAIELNLGSFQIHAKDYQENQSLSEAFEIPAELSAQLDRDPQVVGWAPRIIGGGLVSVGENTNIATIVGIDPEKEAATSVFEDKMLSPQQLTEEYPQLYPSAPVSNPYLSAEPQMQIMIGDKLAEKLEAKIGDDLAAMVTGADGSMGADLYTVAGVYHSGSAELDNGIYMHIAEADALLSMYGQVSLISVMLPNSKVTSEVINPYRAQLDPAMYELLSWDQIAPELVDIMALKNASNHLFMAILLIIIGFGILNTIFMTIMERIREYGVLKALGTTPMQIFSLVAFETLFITLLGTALGNLLAFGTTYYLKLNPIDLSSMSEMYEDMGISSLTQLPADPQSYMFINFSVLIFALASLATLYPAIKAARLEPLEALKHT